MSFHTPPSHSGTAAHSTKPLSYHRLGAAASGPLSLLAIMWVVRVVDTVLPVRLSTWGVRAWDFGSWYAIVTHPFLHFSWAHLLANTVPFLILGTLVALQGRGRFLLVTCIAAGVSAVGVFVLNVPGTITAGASSLVFGYFGYLVTAVFFVSGWKKKLFLAAISVAVIGLYGTTFVIGVLPAATAVSWQGHLTGALGGVLAAWLSGYASEKPVAPALNPHG